MEVTASPKLLACQVTDALSVSVVNRQFKEVTNKPFQFPAQLTGLIIHSDSLIVHATLHIEPLSLGEIIESCEMFSELHQVWLQRFGIINNLPNTSQL